MSSSYQSQYYPQQSDNNNLGLLTTGALAGGGLATVALLNKDKLVQDMSLPVGEGVMAKALECLRDDVLEADLPKLINTGGGTISVDRQSIEQARLTKEIYK